MAQLLQHARNKLLDGITRVIGRTVSLSSGTATAFTVPKNSTTTIPGTITLTATTNKFIAPSYAWSYRFGDTGNFTTLTSVTGTTYDVLGDAAFVTAATNYTLVQYKVVVTETSGPTATAESTVSLYIFREGANSIAAQFSNSTIMVFSDSAGVVPANIYSQLTSTLTIYNGTADDSANWTIALTSTPTGLTASIVDGKTVAISNIASTFTSGVIKVTASRQGYSSIVKELPVTKIADPVALSVEIESTKGSIFRPGTSTSTMLIAHVFSNGIEITDTIDASKFRWRRVSYEDQPYPNDDNTWNNLHVSGYKVINLVLTDVSQRATFHCDILD